MPSRHKGPSIRPALTQLSAVVAVVALGGALALAPRGTMEPRWSSVSYLYDAGHGDAVWITARANLDPVDRDLFLEPQDLAWLRQHPLFRGAAARAARAPTIAFAAPQILALGPTQAGPRSMRFHITPARDGGTMFLSARGVRAASVDGSVISPGDLAVATWQGFWGLRFVGVPRDGIDVVLSFASDIPPTLDVVELAPGLPREAVAAWVRPSEVVSRPGFIAGCTLVAVHYGS